MRDWLRRKLIHWLIKDLFHAVSAEDLLQIRVDENLESKISHKGTELTLEEKQELLKQAEEWEKSFLWKSLRDNVRYEAQQIMFIKSTDFGGMMFGKAALWTIEQIEKAIENLKKQQ